MSVYIHTTVYVQKPQAYAWSSSADTVKPREQIAPTERRATCASPEFLCTLSAADSWDLGCLDGFKALWVGIRLVLDGA